VHIATTTIQTTATTTSVFGFAFLTTLGYAGNVARCGTAPPRLLGDGADNALAASAYSPAEYKIASQPVQSMGRCEATPYSEPNGFEDLQGFAF
jgi:hypothetical protein